MINSMDWTILVEDLDDIERLEKIADVLDSGTPSELFCKTLAGMFRSGKKNCTPFELKLKRKGRGRPTKRRDWDRVAYEMVRLVDIQKISDDEAIFRIQRKFGKSGNSRTQCFKALRDGRRFMQLDGLWEKMKLWEQERSKITSSSE